MRIIKWFVLLIVLFALILSAYIYSSGFTAKNKSLERAVESDNNDTAIPPPWYSDPLDDQRNL